MYTQCPTCQTLFRIRAEQLSAANGRAHCCRCDQVFNALENLHESAESFETGTRVPGDPIPPPTEPRWQADIPDHDKPLEQLLDELEREWREPESLELDLPEIRIDPLQMQRLDHHWKPALPEQPGSEPAPTDKDISATPLPSRGPQSAQEESSFIENQGVTGADDPSGYEQLCDYPDETETSDYHEAAPEASPAVPPGESAGKGRHATEDESLELPFEINPGLPPLPPGETAALPVEELLEQQQPGRRHTLLWSILILALLVTALGQLAWFGRERLMIYPEGRKLLGWVCRQLDCTVPTRRAPELIQVLSRSISTSPELPGVLQVELEFRNQADFPQPFPAIQLQLFGSDPTPLARRTFPPQLYRKGEDLRKPLAPGARYRVRLQLLDPDPQMSGFRFDFL